MKIHSSLATGLPTTRLPAALLICSTLAASWLGMQAVHEAGHVLGALVTGGQVERVVLHPLSISRTDIEPNPNPLLVVWAGPVVGVLAPLLLWGVIAALGLGFAFVIRFFAGFCLIANGAYIGAGSFTQIGDCGEMLRHDSPLWTLWLFGLLTAPVGLWLWNGQGVHFGIGAQAKQVDFRLAWSVFVIAAFLGILGWRI